MSSLNDNPWTDQTSAPGPSRTGSSLFPLSSSHTQNSSNAKSKPAPPKSPQHTEDSTSNRGLIPVLTEQRLKSTVPELTAENMAENDRAFAEFFFGQKDPQSEGQRLTKGGRLETEEERYVRRVGERKDREREEFFRRLE